MTIGRRRGFSFLAFVLVITIAAPAWAGPELIPLFGGEHLSAAVSTRVFLSAAGQKVSVPVVLCLPGCFLASEVFTKPATESETTMAVTGSIGTVDFTAAYKVWASSIATYGGFPHGSPYAFEGRGDLLYHATDSLAVIYGGLSDHGVDAYLSGFVVTYAGIRYEAGGGRFVWREMLAAEYFPLWRDSAPGPFQQQPVKRIITFEVESPVSGHFAVRSKLDYLGAAWDMDYALTVVGDRLSHLKGAVGWRVEHQMLFPTMPDSNWYAEINAAF